MIKQYNTEYGIQYFGIHVYTHTTNSLSFSVCCDSMNKVYEVKVKAKNCINNLLR